MTGQRQAFEEDTGSEQGCHASDVLGWADRIDVENGKIRAGQGLQKIQTFPGRCATALRLAHARGTGRIEKVHVKTEVGRPVADSLAKIGAGFAHAATEQIAPGNNLEP